jgi:hypothetical protein
MNKMTWPNCLHSGIWNKRKNNYFTTCQIWAILPVKMARKITVLQLIYQTEKFILILEKMSKTEQQSPLYQRLGMCSVLSIYPVSSLCVSASSKGSETSKERKVRPESVRQFPKLTSSSATAFTNTNSILYQLSAAEIREGGAITIS